jgi:hypothetical protein
MMSSFESKNEIVVYQADNLTSVEVKLGNDTVWLNRNQIASLFNRDVKTIGKHINNVFFEAELVKEATVANFATVQMEGDREVVRQIEHYNLDVIISVGYRVKSKQGTRFRIWANKILKDYLLKGYAVNKRIDRIEDNVHALIRKVDEIDLQIKSNLPPRQGIFYDGQVFDAYAFVADIIKKAKTEIILIDNYVDESVLTLLAKRDKNVAATICTKTSTTGTGQASRQFSLDLKKFNSQYPEIKVCEFNEAHDRFLIIDQKELYHFGASLKDLGKKWFAFSRMDSFVDEVLHKINKEGNKDG